MKNVITGREKFNKNKNKILFIIKIVNMLPLRMRKKLLKHYRNKNTTFGILMRYCIFKTLAKECGDNVLIGLNVELKEIQKMKIGSNVSIHNDCYLDAGGEIEIGDNVSIAHNTSIISVNHTWNDKEKPIKYNEMEYKKICVNEDVWIGARCVILAGVHIGKRVVIGAGAIVTKNIENNSIAVGVPAKVIKKI